MRNVRELALKIKIDGPVIADEPLSGHTSFRIGGPADLYAAPPSVAELARLSSLCRSEGIPCFLLGGGTNILVSDRGIRGLVIDLSLLRGIERDGEAVLALAGTPMSEVSEFAFRQGLSGLEFTYSLPGSVGGAVWMNARCYERSVSDALSLVEVLADDGTSASRDVTPSDWGYKRSPFQATREAIVKARFHLEPAEPAGIKAKMDGFRQDREAKGHFLHPSAGSVFKNNRAFGAPTGRLLDSLGLKGHRIGDAQIAPYHANIIVNLGEARADDVLALIRFAESEVERRLGFRLEREIIPVGEW